MSRTCRVCVTLTVLGLLTALSLQFDSALGQPPRRPVRPVDIDGTPSEEQTLDGLAIPKDREATAIIQAATEYVKKKDWDTAARSLQYLLEKPEDSFFEIKRKDEKGKEYTARISIRIEANRLIGELPPEGLETYRQKYGQRALTLLQEAIDKNDPATLSMVALRYRHTEAGVKAIHLLGNYFLDRGNYQLASGKFQELLELLEKEKPEVRKEIGPKTFFKAALAYQRFGDSQMADKLWKQVAELAGEKGIAFGKQTYTVAQLRTEFERNAQVGPKTLQNVPVVRGDHSRTAQGVGGMPFLGRDWAVDMFVPDKAKEKDDPASPWLKTSDWVRDKIRSATEMLEKGSGAGKRAMLPGFFPIAGNNRVIFRTYDGVYAFFLRDNPALDQKAGEIAWGHETDFSLHGMGNEYLGRRGTTEGWWGQYYSGMNGVAVPGILFENSLVGTLSHDNSLVYIVDDLALPPHPVQTQQMMYNGQTPFGAFTDEVLYSSMHAVDLDTGVLKWDIGGRKPGSKYPTFNPNAGGIRAIRQPDGKIKRVMIQADGTEIEVDANGKPIKKEEPVKPFVPPKELPENRAFLNAGDELLDSYFLGPPLPIGGKIYVLVEYNGEIQLCCINPKRVEKCKVAIEKPVGPGTSVYKVGPELVWRQPLGTANTKLMQDTMRRIQPCHLAYNDGILICPTNHGALVAVNLLTQSLAWAYSYRTGQPENPNDEMQRQQQMMGGRRFRGDMGYMMNMSAERWYPAPPAIVNGNVVFTAPDSNAVVCLSLRDGQRRWAVNRQAGDLYMAGVYNNKVLIVSKDSVRALKLADGTPAWDRPKPIGMPSGQGVASNGKYYLPCKNGIDSPEPQIVEINVDTGEMHATKSRKKDVPGNLIFFDGEVISQNITSVSAYPQLHVKLAEMDARLAKNPNDPAGLTDRGELHLDKGELVMAVDDLRKALDYKPGPDLRGKARSKLYEALTELLQKDFNKGEQHLSLYKDLCLNEIEGDEKQKRESAYLCILGKGREAQGKLVEAFDAYMEFGQLNGAREMVPSVDEPGTLARPDVWARGRILAMIAHANPEQRKPLEERVAKQWQTVKATDDLEKIRAFVQVFGSMFSSGMEARLTLAERLMNNPIQDDQRQAELYLDILRRQRDDLPMAAQATESLARFMVKKGLLRDAVMLYRILGTEFKDVKLRDGRTGADVYNELVTDKRFLPYLDISTPLWDVGKMKGEQVTGPFNNMLTAYFNVEPDGELMPFFRQHKLVIDTQTPSGNGMWQVRLIDRASGETKWNFGNLPANPYLINQGYVNQGLTSPTAGWTRFAQVRGHILMLTMQHMVYAWDLSRFEDRKPLWEVNLLGKNANAQLMDQRTEADGTIRLIYAGGTSVRIGQMGLLESSYACLPTRDGLVALDPATGAVLWKRDMAPGAQLFGDAEYVFAVETGDDGNPTAIHAVRAADGVAVKVPSFTELYHPSRRIAIVGRNLLVFDDDPKGGKALHLYDVLTGKDVWRQAFPEGSKVIRSQDTNLAGVIHADGTVFVFDTHSGKALIQVKDSAEDGTEIKQHLEGVKELTLLHDADNYYVVMNKASEQGVQSYPFVSNGLRSMRVHGSLYCFPKTGRFEWYRDNLENQFIILENFDELPIVILGAMVNRFNQAQTTGIEAIDKKTGMRIFGEPIPNNGNGQFYAMHTDAKAGVIELLRYDRKIRFTPMNGPRTAEKSGDGSGPGPSGPMGPGGPIPPPAAGPIQVQRIQIQVAVPAAAPALPPAPPIPVAPPTKPAEKAPEKPPEKK